MSAIRKRLVDLAPVLFVLLWSTGFVVARLTAGHVEPLTFLAIRFPLAGMLLAVMAFSLKSPALKPREAARASIAGVFLHAAYLAPIYWAVSHGMPGGVSALIVGLQPLLTAIMAGLILKDPIGRQHWTALAVGCLGVALVLAPKFDATALAGITPVTAGLCLFGTAAVAFGTVYQKRHAGSFPLVTSIAWQYLGASIVVIGLAAATEQFQFDGSFQAWFGLLWSVLVLSLAAIFLLMMLIRDGAVAKVSSLIFLVPGVSATMTYLLFGETLTLAQMLGMLVCAAAVMIVNRRTGKPLP